MKLNYITQRVLLHLIFTTFPLFSVFNFRLLCVFDLGGKAHTTGFMWRVEDCWPSPFSPSTSTRVLENLIRVTGLAQQALLLTETSPQPFPYLLMSQNTRGKSSLTLQFVTCLLKYLFFLKSTIIHLTTSS